MTANLVHTGIVDLASISSSSKSYQDDMEFGNKMAVLSGDFLLANACTGLAELKDTEVVQMISEVIGHLMEGEFLKITFNADNLNLEFWSELSFKCKGSLMANSCKAALKIVGHSAEVRIDLCLCGDSVALDMFMYLKFLHQTSHSVIICHQLTLTITAISPPDLINNSAYCLPTNSYDVSSENLVLDRLIIP